MAITKKHIAIREQKAAYVRLHEELLSEIKASCQKVPEVVLHGDARLAVEWRNTAEGAWNKSVAMPRSLTVSAMGERIAALNKTLDFLRSPSVA